MENIKQMTENTLFSIQSTLFVKTNDLSTTWLFYSIYGEGWRNHNIRTRRPWSWVSWAELTQLNIGEYISDGLIWFGLSAIINLANFNGPHFAFTIYVLSIDVL